MAENEDAFTTATQEEEILARSRDELAERGHGRSRKHGCGTGEMAVDDEESPLLPLKSHANTAPRRATSPSRTDAIAEPWTAFEGLPWYKRPSVNSSTACAAEPLLTSMADLLAVTCILPFLSLLGRTHCPEDIPHPQLDMSKLSI